MAWTKDMFGVEKPIIALLHLRAYSVVFLSWNRCFRRYRPAKAQDPHLLTSFLTLFTSLQCTLLGRGSLLRVALDQFRFS